MLEHDGVSCTDIDMSADELQDLDELESDLLALQDVADGDLGLEYVDDDAAVEAEYYRSRAAAGRLSSMLNVRSSSDLRSSSSDALLAMTPATPTPVGRGDAIVRTSEATPIFHLTNSTTTDEPDAPDVHVSEAWLLFLESVKEQDSFADTFAKDITTLTGMIQESDTLVVVHALACLSL